MELRSFDDARAFKARTEPFLMEHEACHNLLLGLSAALIHNPERFERDPYLATVEREGEVVAAALMTPPNNLVLSRVEDQGALSLIAADLRKRYGRLPGLLAPTEVAGRFAETWQRVSGQRCCMVRAERIYQIEEVTPAHGAPGALRRATEADRPLLVGWLAAFHEEAVGAPDATAAAERSLNARLHSDTGGLYLWEDGRPVSLAGYGGPTPNGVRVGPVYTPPEHRGRGYASACVAALSSLLLEGGRRYCFLFTDLGNPTSNHIYQQVGYRPVCDVDEYEFV